MRVEQWVARGGGARLLGPDPGQQANDEEHADHEASCHLPGERHVPVRAFPRHLGKDEPADGARDEDHGVHDPVQGDGERAVSGHEARPGPGRRSESEPIPGSVPSVARLPRTGRGLEPTAGEPETKDRREGIRTAVHRAPRSTFEVRSIHDAPEPAQNRKRRPVEANGEWIGQVYLLSPRQARSKHWRRGRPGKGGGTPPRGLLADGGRSKGQICWTAISCSRCDPRATSCRR